MGQTGQIGWSTDQQSRAQVKQVRHFLREGELRFDGLDGSAD